MQEKNCGCYWCYHGKKCRMPWVAAAYICLVLLVVGRKLFMYL